MFCCIKAKLVHRQTSKTSSSIKGHLDHLYNCPGASRYNLCIHRHPRHRATSRVMSSIFRHPMSDEWLQLDALMNIHTGCSWMSWKSINSPWCSWMSINDQSNICLIHFYKRLKKSFFGNHVRSQSKVCGFVGGSFWKTFKNGCV